MEMKHKDLAFLYRRYYNLGMLSSLKERFSLTGNPELDLEKEKVRVFFLHLLFKINPLKEKWLHNLSLALEIPEEEAYRLRSRYRKNPQSLHPLLRSFFSNLNLLGSSDKRIRKKAEEKLGDIIKLIKERKDDLRC